MFEFQCGYVPFGEEEEDPFEIYKLILQGNFEFPNYFLTPENELAKSFIQLLLNSIPEARLNGGFAALKSHLWFEDFDWDALVTETLKPPYKPPDSTAISKDEIDLLKE